MVKLNLHSYNWQQKNCALEMLIFLNSQISCISTSFKKEISILSHMTIIKLKNSLKNIKINRKQKLEPGAFFENYNLECYFLLFCKLSGFTYI